MRRTIETDSLINDLYTAKDHILSLGYDQYTEMISIPTHPETHHLFSPALQYIVTDDNGDYLCINAYCMALGGVLISDEI